MLSGLSSVYGKIISYRNSFFDDGRIVPQNLGRTTISIGNITVGGTGKTPLVKLFAEILAKRGEKPCIISRGYRRKNPKSHVLVSDFDNVLVDERIAGDEPFELASGLLGKAIVVSNPNRIQAAEKVLVDFDVTVFLLDDGFQHRRAERDLDVVAIDCTKPFGNFKTLPSGILREPISHLSRADLFILTRADLVGEVDSIISVLRRYNGGVPILLAENYVELIYQIDINEAVNLEEFRYENRVFLFSGIGNPKAFEKQLDKDGFAIAGTKVFRDHHVYTVSDIKQVESEAIKSRANCLLTTKKDAGKLQGFELAMPCYVVESGVRINKTAELDALLEKTLNS